MDSASPREPSLASSPYSSPTFTLLLKKTIHAWSQETNLNTSVRVRIDGKTYDLHKSPLVSKCGYFNKAFTRSPEIELPESFPGGSQAFELIALFIYGHHRLPFDPFNVVALRCGAEFLEMGENYFSGNLCERSDLYINQVVLQSWDDTLIVLQSCQSLLPWSEDLLITSRCVESLAFMACMEILDPERRRDRPALTLQAFAGRAWDCEAVKESARTDLWIRDLIALPFAFFKRIVGSLRRQGMKEKYVSPIVVFYANKWVLSKKTHQFWEVAGGEGGDGGEEAKEKACLILRGVVDLLRAEEKGCGVVPVAFYFALLARAVELGVDEECEARLRGRVVSMLHLARAEDFLLDGEAGLAMMERLVSVRMSSDQTCDGVTPLSSNDRVAELWDAHILRVAVDPELGSNRFVELINVVPMSERRSHDHLYKAMNTFLQEHPETSQEEKALICKHLNCQKLSQETRIEAVQNELMPLRLIVQALFIQQLNTHQAFKECSDSLRYTHSGVLSSLPKSPSKQASTTDEGLVMGTSLGVLLQKEISREDYESTSFRIQTLEQELVSLKRGIKSKSCDQKSQSFRVFVKKRSCMGGLNLCYQRRCVNQLMKAFGRIAMFGRGRSKRKRGSKGGSDGRGVCNRNNDLYDVYDC
ncbi:BTB/POZ domain-containing protein [Acorus calamus]|uniref:BTB/POZ domain-containing protein n=1 Tax=Acorus calamus TaxID=4465 RepID=A0AAV9EYA8_ACOCL|nr:BTB/POZ domain-containing protein [Acorus calamus]